MPDQNFKILLPRVKILLFFCSGKEKEGGGGKGKEKERGERKGKVKERGGRRRREKEGGGDELGEKRERGKGKKRGVRDK